MQFRDLKRQYQVLQDEIDPAVKEVMSQCNFINGAQVKELEQELAEYVDMKHCITCANGTDALTMMLMAWNIKEGDAVFVPDFTFFASAEVVSFAGATPVFYDVDKDTFNADVSSLEVAIERVIKEGKLKPRVIIAVDLFGLPANYDELENIASKKGLLLLEDAAQGFGGKVGMRRSCSFGDAATTSFFPAKPLGCYGDGGAIFTNDDKVADYLESIRVHGKGSFKYDNVRIGLNSRLDTIQAAILKVKFKAFCKYELDAINAVAELYTNELHGTVKTPFVPEGYYSSWAQYTIQLASKEQRQNLQNYLKSFDIPTMIYYPKQMCKQIAFKDTKVYVDLQNSEKLCDTVLALPIHPYMPKEEVLCVSEKIKEFLD